MTTGAPSAAPAAPSGPAESLTLRPSLQLSRVPPEPAPAAALPAPATPGTSPAPAAASAADPAAASASAPAAEGVAAAPAAAPVPAPPAPAAAPPVATQVSAPAQRGVPAESSGPPLELPPYTGTWFAASAALLAGVGWVWERRRRRLLEMEKDSVFWANVQQPGPGQSIITTAGGLDDILPDSPDPAEAARAIYVTAIGETNSRREATLIDLHQLQGKLRRRRDRGDNVAALLLLQQHLVDFRYTSPWVFLELLDLYKVLDRQMEWEVARDAFRQRFGQNAPAWNAPSTADAELADDRQLSEQLANDWPYREARMFILRWVLGDPQMRLKNSGPPLLALGVYRDLMLLDAILDEVVVVRTQPADSLL